VYVAVSIGLYGVSKLLPEWPHSVQWPIWYAIANLVFLSACFAARIFNSIIGKNVVTGKLPLWSYIVFWPFHATNFIAILAKRFFFRRHVPFASEIRPGLWIGGLYSNFRDEKWQGVVDLTTEFSERSKSKEYLCIPIWDGTPPTLEQISQGATFVARNWKQGPTIVHCAAGIGRSTTLLCAALICSNEAKTVDEAFMMIKEKRPIVRLNTMMRKALEEWFDQYKKEQ